MIPTRFSGLLLCILLYSVSCQQKPPNVLFIAVDDLRPELGVYGASHIHSPNIDRLAAEGTLFERAYCNVPVCGSSRASLLSGVRPGWHRFEGSYKTYLQEDYPGVTSLPKHFRKNNYYTASLGKVYHHLDDDSLAWDTVWRPKPQIAGSWRNYLTKENIRLQQTPGQRGKPYEKTAASDTAYFDGKIASEAIRQLQQAQSKDQPFFLAVGFLKPHLPFNAPEKYWQLYDSSQITLPDNYLQPKSTPSQAFHNFGELRNYSEVPKEGAVSEEMAKKLIHGYYACVSYTDAQIGRLLDALERLGLAENTIVVLWGDHGWNLGDHAMWCKHCNFESSLHVPLLVKAPGMPTGQRAASIVEFVDIYPTLSELAQLPLPEHLEGESMVPLMQGKSRAKDYAIAKYYGGVTLIKDRFFYTEWIDEQANVQARMLFDHERDPLELENLAERPNYAEQADTFSNFLRQHWGKAFFQERGTAAKPAE